MSISVNQIKVSIGGTESTGFKIEIAGAKYRLDSFIMRQQLLKPSSLSFSLRKDPEEDISEIQFTACSTIIGKEVKLSLQTDSIEKEQSNFSGGEKTADLEFEGFINSAHASRYESEYIIQVEAQSKDAAMLNHPNCYMYNSYKLEAIVQEVAKSRNNLEIDGSPKYGDDIFYTTQYNESDYEFLMRLAQRYGEWMFNNGTKFHFGQLKDQESIQLKYPSLDIEEYSISMRTFHQMFGHVALTYNEMGKGSTYKGEEQKDTGNDLNDSVFNASKQVYPARTRFIMPSPGIETDDQVSAGKFDDEVFAMQAKVEQQSLRSNMLLYEGTTYCSRMKVGVKLTILDNYINGESSEKSEVQQDEILVTSVTHTFGVDDEYKNQFQGITAKIEYPPYFNPNVYPHCDHPVRAYVVETDDPKHWGRVKVRFPWQNKEYRDGNKNGMSPWIHVSQPYTGGEDKKFGVHLIPEKFTEVYVDFEEGNFERPFVSGTQFVLLRQVDEAWNPGNNNVKAIRTASGHTIEIHDNISDKWGSGGFIHIYDNDTQVYDIMFSTDQKLISMNCKGDINIHADGNISMSAGGSISNKAGKHVSNSAGGDFNAGAGGTFNGSAGGEVIINAGSNFSAKAAAKMDLTASDEMTIASANNMSIDSNKEMSVSSEEDMLVVSHKNYTMTVEKDNNVTVNKNLNFSVMNNAEIKATNNLNISAMNITEKATADFKEYSATHAIKATGSVSVNATASIDLKAVIINEN